MRALTERQKEILSFVSAYISDNGRAPTQREVGTAFGFSHTAARDALASLERRGLLLRQTDPANRRNLIVTLTPKGVERLRQKELQVERRLQELLAELGGLDAAQFVELVNKMDAALSVKKKER